MSLLLPSDAAQELGREIGWEAGDVERFLVLMPRDVSFDDAAGMLRAVAMCGADPRAVVAAMYLSPNALGGSAE